MVQALLPGGVEAPLAVTAGWMLTYLGHSLLLLGAAWVLDRRTPVTRSPRARAALWTAAVAGGLVTASVQAATGLGPGLDVDVAESEKLVAELPAPAPGAEGPTPPSTTVAEPRRRSGPAAAARAVDAEPRRSAGGARALPGPALTAPSDLVTWRTPHRPAADAGPWLHAVEHGWPFLLALGGLLGGAAGAVRHALRRRRLRRRLASRTPVREGPLREALDGMSGAVGRSEDVVLSRSPSVPAPVALPGGEICVPEGMAPEMDAESRRAVLAHELAHLERGDPHRLAALRLLESVFFFQPLNRLARRRIVAAWERISDDRVRRLGLGPALADALVTAAARLRDGAVGPAPGLASAPDVTRRVGRLLESPVEEEAATPRTTALLPAALLAIGLAAGPGVGVQLVDHPPHVDADPRGGSSPAVSVARSSSLPGIDAGGAVARVRLEGGPRPLRVTLRPATRPSLRLTVPGGRTVRAPAPADREGRRPTIRVSDAGAGDYVLHVPPGIDRLALDVDGRFLVGAPGTATGELPELVAPAPDGG